MSAPWPEMMRTAVALGVSPEGFWRLSLREWRWLTTPSRVDTPLGRAALEELAARWPDGGCDERTD